MAPQATLWLPSARRKPTVAPIATTNSAALTVPITWFGLRRLAAIIVDVVTGPQPPPPIESTTPPIMPRGPNVRQRGVYRRIAGARFSTVRARIRHPRAARINDTQGAATSAASWVSATAPTNAPMAPGTASMTKARQCTFPKRQCAAPDIKPVPILATWMVADAVTGLKPTPARSVAEVTP